MLNIYKCELIGLTHGRDGFRAVVVRRSNHAVLGPPTDGITITSVIKYIDFELSLMKTENSYYDFSRRKYAVQTS